MSISVPKLSEVNDNIINQLQSSLNKKIPLLPKAFIRVLSKVLAAVFILLYKYAGFIALQMFVRFATYDETEINGKLIRPLLEWGRLIGVEDPTEATKAELTIQVNVTTAIGNLDSGTQLLNTDNGVTYLTIGTVALATPSISVDIRAERDQAGGNGAGALGNLDLGATVSFANPLPNIEQDATVTAQLVTAADAETVEAYRQRVVDRFQKIPQGGAYADYELWGEEVEGIINVYPYTGDPGEVDVYSEATEASSGSADGIPTAAQLTAVSESIELDGSGLASRRSANAYVNSYAITRTAFTVEVTGLIADNPTETQTKITEAIEAYFLDREPYIHGLSIPPRKDRITQSEVAGAVANVASAFGALFSSANVKLAGVITAMYILGEGEKAKTTDVVFL